LSTKWKMQTPPYVLLLIRTFLTLEGIASRVDPDFNIYEMAMPWAIRRSLSPSTIDGIKTLRSTILKEDGKIQWSRFVEMVETAVLEKEKKTKVTSNTTISDESSQIQESKEQNTSSSDTAKARAMNDAVVTLLGSPEGAVLRRLIQDFDSIDFLKRLLSKDAKFLRKQAVLAIFSQDMRRRRNKRTTTQQDIITYNDSKQHPTTKLIANARPMSEQAIRLRERQRKWTRKVTKMLMQEHLLRIWKSGLKTWLIFCWLTMRLVAGMINQRILFFYRESMMTTRLFLSKSKMNQITRFE